MPRLITHGAGLRSARKGPLFATLVTLGGMIAGSGVLASAQNSKYGPTAPVTYDNKYEVYGGANFMNFQAGQNLPNRMNLGGAEVSATYWVTPRLGAAIDYRGEVGTTPVFPFALQGMARSTRRLVYMNMGMVGVQYRGPKNHYAAINYHALIGADAGVFSSPVGQNVGLYNNSTKPIAAVGGSLDYNRSARIALRLSPDLILEHFGSETREFFAVSAGVLYRF